MENVLPAGTLSKVSVPPWASTILRAIGSPRPVPPRFVVVKKSRRQPRFDPRPRVVTDRMTSPGGAGGDANRAALRRGVHGVAEEVDQNLLDFLAVEAQRRNLSVRLLQDREAFSRATGPIRRRPRGRPRLDRSLMGRVGRSRTATGTPGPARRGARSRACSFQDRARLSCSPDRSAATLRERRTAEGGSSQRVATSCARLEREFQPPPSSPRASSRTARAEAVERILACRTDGILNGHRGVLGQRIGHRRSLVSRTRLGPPGHEKPLDLFARHEWIRISDPMPTDAQGSHSPRILRMFWMTRVRWPVSASSTACPQGLEVNRLTDGQTRDRAPERCAN